VEERPVQLLVVCDRKARPVLSYYGEQRKGSVQLVEGLNKLRRFRMVLGQDDQIRFIWPSSRSFTGPEVPSDLFDASRDYTAKDGGILWLLGHVVPETESSDQRLADAVAVAGLQPRAVLLVLGEKSKDTSRYETGAVRHYLESVRVPLIVWSIEERSSPAVAAWGDAEDISSFAKLQTAFERLEKLLAAERILWIEGSHLPGEITLSPAAAETVELAR